MTTHRAMPVLQVRDVVASEAFYRQLGFDTHGPWGDPPAFTIMQRGDVTLALDRARRALADAHNTLALNVLSSTSPAIGNGTERLEDWLSSRQRMIARTERAVDEVVNSGEVSISRIAVASGMLSDLAGMSQAS